MPEYMLVSISEDEYEGIEEACNSLEVNPYDLCLTLDWLITNNCLETASWIAKHEEEYFRGITYGFRVYEDMSEIALAEGVEVYIVTPLR